MLRHERISNPCNHEYVIPSPDHCLSGLRVGGDLTYDWVDWNRHTPELVALEERLRFGEPWLVKALAQDTEKKLGGVVASRLGRLVGYIAYEISPPELIVCRIAVCPEHHRQAVGAGLMTHLKHERVWQNECREIIALLSEYDSGARSFFSSQGFIPKELHSEAGLYGEDIYGFSCKP